MSNYTIVIPTYKRSDLIWQRGTLKFLKSKKINKNKIILFVADEKEKEIYKKSVPKDMYSGKIVVGIKGLVKQRNFIVKYFPENKYLVSMDDDVYDLFYKFSDKKLKSCSSKQLHNLLKNSYHLMKRTNTYIWGINLVSNPFMMQYKVSTNLGIIPAFFYGWINRHSMVNKIDNSSREDVERSVMFFKKDGAILRYMHYTPNTNMKSTDGGIQSLFSRQKREQMEDKFTKSLKKLYPQYCCIDKKGGIRMTLKRHKSELQFNKFTKKNMHNIHKYTLKNNL